MLELLTKWFGENKKVCFSYRLNGNNANVPLLVKNVVRGDLDN